MKAFIISLSIFLFTCNAPLQAQLFWSRIDTILIQDSIFRQMEMYPQEKIHLHIDRDFYVPGEKIWFKAYIIDAATHYSPAYSSYVYVELINSSDSLITRVMVRQENEMFHGHLFLSELIPAGQYTVRAYTKFMENMGDDYFFKKNIQIGNLPGEKENSKNKKPQPKTKDDYDVTFYPEGGNLLEGVFCRIAFKALNKNGSSETIIGEVVGEDGKKISDAKTTYAGMGSFVINAERGKQYYLECRNSVGLKKRFKLPDSYARAYSISTIWNDRKNELIVTRKKAAKSPNIKSSDNSQYLLIHSRGAVFYISKWDEKKDHLVFKKDQFPSGVVQLLLLDKDINPLSERLVFNKMNEPIELILSSDKEEYEKRDLVSLTIQLLDFEDNYSGGNLSIAITDDKDVSVDSLTTITSSLLLSSELKGHIETPAYFLQDNKEASYALDHLMMTHGWRRYNIPEVIKGNMEIPETLVENSKEISGLVKGVMSGRPVEKAEVIMMTSAGDVLQAESNKKGEFFFTGFEAPDSVRFFVQSLNKKGRPNVELVVNEEVFPKLKHLPEYISERAVFAEPETDEYGFLKKAEQRAQYDENMRFIQLGEVDVIAKRPENKDEARLRFWANSASDISIRREEIEKRKFIHAVDVIRTIPGVTVLGSLATGYEILIRHKKPILIIDGVYVDDEEANEILKMLFARKIESVDVFKGAGASVFGARGFSGAISITTKDEEEYDRDSQAPNFAVLSPLGYQKPIEFYSPKYDNPDTKYLSNPDYRTTIFWKPDIIINDNEEVYVDFYTSDFASTYSVVIEGITYDGRIIRRVEKINVK